MTLSAFIKQYRSEKNLSQRQMSAICGLSSGYIGLLERGYNRTPDDKIIPSLTVLKKIADGMGISLSELIANVDDMPVTLEDVILRDSEGNPLPPPEVHSISTDPLNFLPTEEKDLITAYRAAEPTWRQVAMDVLKAHRKK